MAEKYDVIIVGAGHNGLMVGAYLAKAGVKVCVLEHSEKVGGGVRTDELTLPGFKHDVCSAWHALLYPNPMFKDDELELFSKFGLEYVSPKTLTGVTFDDGSFFQQHRGLEETCESIARFSAHDAEAYREFYDWSIRVLDMLLMGMYNPTPSFGQTMAMLDSSPEGRVLIKALLSSAWDIVDDWFESDKVKILLTRYAAEQMMSPFTKGTGLHLFLFIPLQHKYGGGVPVGGSGVLCDVLAECLKSHGGVIKLSSTVKEFVVSNDQATGVILANGEEISAARAVVSSINIKQMFPHMVPGIKLPDHFTRGVRDLKHSGFSAFNQHIALKEMPVWKNGYETHWMATAPADPYKFQRAFQDLESGIPSSDVVSAFVSTQIDPTRAPDGQHVLYLYSFAPYELRQGGSQKWDEVKDEVADDILGRVQDLAVNMGNDNILGRAIHSPLFYERHNPTMIKGDICQIGTYNQQMSGNRPLSGWHTYRTPVEKLYLVGASTHPGPGVFGGGRAGVQIIMEDLGIDFEDMIK